MLAEIKHTKYSAHKYKKTVFRQSRTVVFKCTLPGCTHFILPELLLGRKSICWRCEKEHVVIDNGLAKQICESCRSLRRKKKKFNESTIDTLMNFIGGN